MTSKEEDLQPFFQRLEALSPHRDFTIVTLRGMAQLEIEMFRLFGTSGDTVGTPSIVNALLNVLSQDPDPKIRSCAAIELGNIEQGILQDQIVPLFAAAKTAERGLVLALDDKSPKVKSAATKALWKVGTISALEAAPPKPWWRFW
jgi:hypothetical protein